MILIKPRVYNVIDEYTQYLINEGLTSQTRALEKKDQIIRAIDDNLGGLLTHRPSPYKELGRDKDCSLYVFKDSKSRTQWGFAYQRYDENIIVCFMKNMKLIK